MAEEKKIEDGFAKPALPPIARPPTQPQTDRTSEPREAPPLPYDPPEWSAEPTDEYFFEVLKSGQIIDKTPRITKEFIVAGRLPVCDIELEHASISRYHAIVQFKNDGSAHIFDLGSTHGTFINKAQLPKQTYRQLRVGDMIRFGQSTRFYIFQGPPPEEVEEPKFIPSPLREKYQQQQDTEVSWGFAEDASEEDEGPTAHDFEDGSAPDESAYYHSDPKKALRNWLEQRGAELVFHVEEEGHGRDKGFVAKVELPIEVGSGFLTGIGRATRKKVAENEAALDACIKLDKKHLLRSAGSEVQSAVKTKIKKLFGEDEDDEDSFYDRTDRGSRSKAKTAPTQTQAESFETLTKKREEVVRHIQEINGKIDYVEDTAGGTTGGEDELDAYMQQIEQSKLGEKKTAYRRQLPPLEKELARIDKLLKIVTPTGVALDVLQPVKRATRSVAAPAPPPPKAFLPQTEELEEEVDEVPNPAPDVAHGGASASPPSAPSTSEASKKRKGPVTPAQSDETPDVAQADSEAKGAQSKRRKVYAVMTEQQAEEHWKVEGEDAEEWIAPEHRMSDSEIAKMNAAYGY
ncbi:Kanadaptin [Rhizophlyctis rosea]|uniref:Kanadaptin n=1 Tax=Rhizophlyctis rosea TaxID=64517 RepID=A0AAD5X2L3_9FUNG|nr:Kanadaptin [Rhizophlyctis rosea]